MKSGEEEEKEMTVYDTHIQKGKINIHIHSYVLFVENHDTKCTWRAMPN